VSEAGGFAGGDSELRPLAGVLHHVSLPAIDLGRSRAFFRDVLGLREIARPAFDYPGAWFAVGEGQQLHLIAHDRATLRGAKGLDSRDVHFAIRVPSFSGAVEHLAARGYVDVEHAPPELDPLLSMKVNRAARAGFPQVYILDPAHNVIEINAERLDE